MKKLYALLVILIIAYIGINMAADNMDLFHAKDANVTENDTNIVKVGASSFNVLKDYEKNQVNDTYASLSNKDKNLTIDVAQMNETQSKLEDFANKLYKDGKYTSHHTIKAGNITAYVLYHGLKTNYSSDVFFNKNNHTYRITSDFIKYKDADYFLDECKEIINTLNATSDAKEFRRW